MLVHPSVWLAGGWNH